MPLTGSYVLAFYVALVLAFYVALVRLCMMQLSVYTHKKLSPPVLVPKEVDLKTIKINARFQQISSIKCPG